MEINVNTEGASEHEVFFTISPERMKCLLRGTAEIQAKFAMYNNPTLAAIAEMFRGYSGENSEYYSKSINLFKEIVGLCNSIEEVVLILPIVGSSQLKFKEAAFEGIIEKIMRQN